MVVERGCPPRRERVDTAGPRRVFFGLHLVGVRPPGEHGRVAVPVRAVEDHGRVVGLAPAEHKLDGGIDHIGEGGAIIIEESVAGRFVLAVVLDAAHECSCESGPNTALFS